MSHDYSIFSLLNLVESVDEIATTAAARRVRKCELSAWNREIMARIEGLLKHASSEFAKLMNDCRTINRIPPEILTLIFFFAGRGAPVIAASRVCKWWRQVAFSSPTLWSLYSTGFTRLDLVFQRSRKTLLDVKARNLSPWNMEHLLPLQFQSKRLRTFDVSIDNLRSVSTTASFLVKLFPSAATHLTRLSLTIGERHHELPNFGDHFMDGSCFAPLFSGNMPCLKTLHLRGIPVWPQFSAYNLQSLILIESRISLPTLLSALDAVPNLEVLALASLTFVGASINPGCTVTLSRLRTLRVDACIKADDQSMHLYYLLSSLSTQDGVDAGLIDISDVRKESAVHHLETAKQKNYYPLDGMHKLVVDGEIIVSNNRTIVTFSLPSYLRSPSNSMTITPDGIIFDLFHCRLAHVTHFIWKPFGHNRWAHLDVADFSILLGSMPSLESLTLVENCETCEFRATDSSPILSALLEVEPVTHIPRCGLRLVEIAVTFADHYLMSTSFKACALIKLLSGHSASGYPIRQITVDHDVARACVQQMKEYVQDVLVLDRHKISCSGNKSRISEQLSMLEPHKIYSQYFRY